MVQKPLVGFGLLITEVSRSHSYTHHTRQDSSGRVISPVQSPLPDNTQPSQEIDILTPGGIRNCNPRKRLAVDPRIRQHSPWDRLRLLISFKTKHFMLYASLYTCVRLRNRNVRYVYQITCDPSFTVGMTSSGGNMTLQLAACETQQVKMYYFTTRNLAKQHGHVVCDLPLYYGCNLYSSRNL